MPVSPPACDWFTTEKTSRAGGVTAFKESDSGLPVTGFPWRPEAELERLVQGGGGGGAEISGRPLGSRPDDLIEALRGPVHPGDVIRAPDVQIEVLRLAGRRIVEGDGGGFREADRQRRQPRGG